MPQFIRTSVSEQDDQDRPACWRESPPPQDALMLEILSDSSLYDAHIERSIQTFHQKEIFQAHSTKSHSDISGLFGNFVIFTRI